jgi:hypothetical protein
MTGDKKTFTLVQLEAAGVASPAIGRLFKTEGGIIYRIFAQQGRDGWLAKEVLDEAKADREVADRIKARELLAALYDIAKPPEPKETFINSCMFGKTPEQIAELISEWNKRTKGAYEH